MKEKYYTPAIEEFYVGFECEFFNSMQDNVWKHQICNVDDVVMAYDVNEHGTDEWGDSMEKTFRVKYLDRENIEGLLGVKQLGDNDNEMNFQIIENQYSFYEIEYDMDTRTLMVEKFFKTALVVNPCDSYDSVSLFDGKIYNKTEFKWVLKRIGIV